MDQEKIREGVKLTWRELARILKEKDFWRLRTGRPDVGGDRGGMYEDAGVYLSKRFLVDNNEW